MVKNAKQPCGAVRNYFDRLAQAWDNGRSDCSAINAILDRFGPLDGKTVLDVACGAGVLYPFLTARKAARISAVDISPEMCRIYREKYPGAEVLTGDFERELFKGLQFDRVIIYNAFPHFENPEAVFANAFHLLKRGGSLLIAHSMNRAELDEHHRRAGKEVAEHVLISDDEFSALYRRTGFTGVTVNNGAYFYSEGRKPYNETAS
jgi:demethylmenaquinone methyltransferase/2-methoxy-6-polyprenyl-1,4-benzoquinol methylase